MHPPHHQNNIHRYKINHKGDTGRGAENPGNRKGITLGTPTGNFPPSDPDLPPSQDSARLVVRSLMDLM